MMYGQHSQYELFELGREIFVKISRCSFRRYPVYLSTSNYMALIINRELGVCMSGGSGLLTAKKSKGEHEPMLAALWWFSPLFLLLMTGQL